MLKLFYRHISWILDGFWDRLGILSVLGYVPIPVKHAYFEVVSAQSFECLPSSVPTGAV